MNSTTRSHDAARRNDLVERYVREVGRRLPRRRRTDVVAELRALLHDQIDDALAERPDADHEEVAAATLREMGPPDHVASGYAPASDVWIGPELYPAFRTTAVIVLVVYSILTGLWALGSFQGDIALIPFHLRFDATQHWPGVMLGAIANVGVVSLLFGVIERLGRLRKARAAAWDPRELPRIEEPDRISVPGEMVGLTLTALFALVMNFAPEWLGLSFHRGDEWGTFPVLSPEYRAHLPWLNAWWAAAFTLHAALLWQGRWRLWSRAAELALGLFGAAILYRIVTGGPFTFLDVLVKPALIVALVVTLVASLVRAARLVRRLAHRELDPEPSSYA